MSKENINIKKDNMKLIAHRGNLYGPEKDKENQISHIERAIGIGFDVEIDIRSSSDDNVFYLGHDRPENKINISWLKNFSESLWIHCKDINSLRKMNGSGLKYFWHDNDSFTLTSNELIWTYPRRTATDRSIVVCKTKEEFDHYYNNTNCYGVCSDYVGLFNGGSDQ